ncbi:MAG: mechanosensitive ion channel, partial [Nannocystaceae bacterium]|nr:mechanosensitive ion channel [Nannocystaceae bacterium]
MNAPRLSPRPSTRSLQRRLTTLLLSILTPVLLLWSSVGYAAPSGPAGAAAPPPPPGTGGAWSDNLSGLLSDRLFTVGGKIAMAIGLFILGWIVAKSISYAVFSLLSRTDLDNRLAERLGINMLLRERKEGDEGGAVERFAAKAVYLLLMLLVVVGVLQFAGLGDAAKPLAGFVDTIVQAIPKVAKATLILIIAYVAGRILSTIVTRSLDGIGVDERFAKLAETERGEGVAFPDAAGKVLFWLLIVVGLAGAFEALEIEPLAGPLHNAINTIITLIPRLAIAALIVFVGYIVGKILRVVVRNALSGLGFDKLMERFGLDKFTGKSTWSDLIGMLLMVFVMLQATIAALEKLELTSLAGNLTAMVRQIWAMLPTIAVSVLIIAVAVLVGTLLRKVIGTALRNVGFDRLLERLGFGKISEREDRLGEFSELVAYGAQVGVILLGVAQALDNLSLDTWSVYVNTFLAYIVQNVAVALVVVLVGFVIGGYVRDLILARTDDDEADDTSRWVAEFARYVVLVFAFTMAVRQLDVAEDFVLLTFGLLFGSLCLAMALAFGLGSREVAGEIVKKRYDQAKGKLGRAGIAKPRATGA